MLFSGLEDLWTQEAAVKCPACHETMHHVMVRDIEIDVCPSCAGVFLDPSELDLLLGLSEGAGVEERLDQTASLPETCRYCTTRWPGRAACGDCGQSLGLSCPRDDKGMYIVEAAGVELDRCPGCKGIWVDGFERSRLSSMKETLRETARIAVVGAWADGEEAVPVEEPVPEFRATIDQFRSVEIHCVKCEAALSRYRAWKRPDGFWCPSCAKEDGDAAATYQTLEKCMSVPRAASDEEQVLDALKWAVGGLFNKAKGR